MIPCPVAKPSSVKGYPDPRCAATPCAKPGRNTPYQAFKPLDQYPTTTPPINLQEMHTLYQRTITLDYNTSKDIQL